jgi:hypothetical protein
MYYSIDDSNGTNICSGIQLRHAAERIAQEYADDLGELVHVYASDSSEEWDVEPSEADGDGATGVVAVAVGDRETYAVMQLGYIGADRYATRAEAQAAVDALNADMAKGQCTASMA